jgi:hypothetical protein
VEPSCGSAAIGTIPKNDPLQETRGNWVSSRSPLDLPAFDRAVVAHFAEACGREAPSRVVDVGWGRLLVGTAAVAAAGLTAQRVLRTAPH